MHYFISKAILYLKKHSYPVVDIENTLFFALFLVFIIYNIQYKDVVTTKRNETKLSHYVVYFLELFWVVARRPPISEIYNVFLLNS